MDRIRRHLSYANVAATLALVFAMTGGAIAATGGFTSGGKLQACVGSGGTLKLIKGGQRCHHGQQKVAWNQTGPQGPVGPTGPTGPTGPSGLTGQTGTSPTIPGKVTAAETALTANNALALGGTPASGFTHNDCVSETGQVKGFAEVPASGTYPESFTSVPVAYNCSGGAVEAMRENQGEYIVRFSGNPAAIAMATANAGSFLHKVDTVTVFSTAPGEWKVSVYAVASKELTDDRFELLVP
jgi:hypothetical protein